MPDIDPSDVLPQNNLPSPSAQWGRALEKRLLNVEKRLLIDNQDIAGQNRTTAATLASISEQLTDISDAQAELVSQQAQLIETQAMVPVTKVFSDEGTEVITSIGMVTLPVTSLEGGGSRDRLSVLSSLYASPVSGSITASLVFYGPSGEFYRSPQLNPAITPLTFGTSVTNPSSSPDDIYFVEWEIYGSPVGQQVDYWVSSVVSTSQSDLSPGLLSEPPVIESEQQEEEI